MDIKELFSGVAVIIDDKVKATSGDLILNIKEKLLGFNIPIIEFDNIPDNQFIKNLKNVSFILLDWELYESSIDGVPIGAEAKRIAVNRNFKFLRKLKKEIFVPIFIFSNSSRENIIRQLIDKRLYCESKPNYIFVKRKQDLFDSTYTKCYFFKIISNWIKSIPSIYVLKEWDSSTNKAKNDLFWTFYNINHKWPSILHKTYTGDGSDVNYELGNFIFKNIMARTEPIKFNQNVLEIDDANLTTKEIRQILEAERFIKNKSLPNMPFTGDLYKKSISGNKYLINIRPDCDLARKNNPSLYLIEGEVIDENLINSTNEEHKNKKIIFDKGFIEKENFVYLPFVDGCKILKFNFKEFKISKWYVEKEKRIGRLLHPYITKIQQRFSFYLQRQGLPAIPEKAIKK
jgi:hypothetical protein